LEGSTKFFDFNTFTSGGYDYNWLGEKISNFDKAVSEHPDMSSIMDILSGLTSIIPIIMMAAMLVIALFGKKLLPIIKVVSCFAVGFGLGVAVINEKLVDIITLPAWISGLIFGVLAVLLYRLIYVLFFAAFSFYGTFLLAHFALGNILASLGDVKGFIFLGIGAIVMIFAFIKRKYVEMLGTAALGGWVLAKLLVAEDGGFLNGISFLVEYYWIIAIVVALIGFTVQVKTRRRY